jgi:Ca2+-binding RTX toxin-like protein
MRKRLVIWGCASGLLIAAPPAAADTAICTYNPATHTAAVAVTSDVTTVGSSMAIRSSDGALLVQSGLNSTPCGTANRTNLDTINVVGTNAATRGAIFRVETVVPFAPGFTDEPGGSDEIEMSFNFSSGGHWFLTPSGTSSSVPLNIAAGSNQLNLNASETDGVDADAVVNGPYNLFIEGSLGADTIRANGTAGTTGQPLAVRMVASTAAGPDVIVGGKQADDLSGGLDPDVILGGRGKDSLKGLAGIDRLFGQAGNDKLLGGPGKDRLNGGKGTADACTPKPDRRRKCELTTKDKK